VTREIRVQAAPDELEELRRMLIDDLGDDVELSEVASQGPGGLREPVLIGLVVALGGPRVVQAVVEVIDRWMAHRERMQGLKTFELALLEDKAKPITLDQLRELGKAWR
jgi:hypothetical protein